MIKTTLLTVREAKQYICYCDTILIIINETDNRPDYSRLLI